MIERLQKLLADCGIKEYSIVAREVKGLEAYFVGQLLDQHRIRHVTHTKLTVYYDFEENEKHYRGSASAEIYPTQNDAQIKAQLQQMYANAALAKNEWYPLVAGQKARLAGQPADLTAVMKTAVEALQGIKNTASEKINSYEIFVNESLCHLVNSQGVDVEYAMTDEMIEVIVNGSQDGHEIELYHQATFADQPVENIKKGIMEVFDEAHDRSQAVMTKADRSVTLILRGDVNSRLFSYFKGQTDVSSIYMHASQAQIGDVLQDKAAETDLITIKACRSLPGSSANQPFGDDGCSARDFTLIDQGVIANLWGSNHAAYYLGIKDIAPMFNYKVSGGSMSLEQMHAKPYLEVVKFSDFQMNEQTGDGGGEIRLAYWFDGSKRIPVTGGSVSFNIRKSLNHLRMSQESRQVDNVIVPEAVMMFDIAVSGE